MSSLKRLVRADMVEALTTFSVSINKICYSIYIDFFFSFVDNDDDAIARVFQIIGLGKS